MKRESLVRIKTRSFESFYKNMVESANLQTDGWEGNSMSPTCLLRWEILLDPGSGFWSDPRITGETYQPWQYFADTKADCLINFGPDSPDSSPG
ncbi:hypothetical protein CEXT_162331 [Caerostris extrusa]|uniref:Uncharacterized protein n=1 Tax=Caerostris extrusa TaxID=172846 RepID=A0AAV4TSS1_CAEEX|nr:hypothetical protein CEXT_162331 [Caerostris extrusa]